MLLVDVLVFARRPHEPTRRECLTALGFYIGLAVLFGIWVWNFHGGQFGLEFYAGWLTEYSLSIDNLFIFVIIMASFKVPKILQQQAAEQTTAMQQADYATRKKQGSWSSRAGQWAGGYTQPWEEAGGRAMSRLSASYEAKANELVGYHEGTVGEAGRKRLRGAGACAT